MSVPQRGSIAVVGGIGTRHQGQLLELAGSRHLGHRGLFLLLGAMLTGTGVLIPHLDSQLISTLFFVTGAGLAMLVVVLPWQPAEQVRETDERGRADIRPAFNAETGRQVRFPELLATPARSGLDRAAWAKLTAHMSHELRTPLNAVLGFSELMSNEVFGPLESSYSAYARDIHASGRILLKSAEDALAITALLTAPERKRGRETCCLRTIIDDACAFAAPDLAANAVAVAVDIKGDTLIAADYQATRQMLINLIVEATRRAANGAMLRIETQTGSEAVSLSLALLSDSKRCPREEGFGIILARTFCELSGTELTSRVNAAGEWTSTVGLPRAVQADLFAAA
ncbi:MAG: HAMP domain-containing sensor histidine kinase [Hyphomicrobium sp.]|uniref:sensor histidine kinase n=1 Tax=Hyphomicrobium sp. TaxID=82 RepID=UPI0039E509A5